METLNDSDVEWEDAADGALRRKRLSHATGVEQLECSLYELPESGFLLAADALTAEGGDLAGPSQQFTLEMDRGLDSAMRLAERDVEGILCYHGGYVPVDAERIREVVGELR